MTPSDRTPGSGLWAGLLWCAGLIALAVWLTAVIFPARSPAPESRRRPGHRAGTGEPDAAGGPGGHRAGRPRRGIDADGRLRLEVTFQDRRHAEWALWQLTTSAEALAPQWSRTSLRDRAAAIAASYGASI